MNDHTRRRRLDSDEPQRGGGIPIFPLILVVVFGGLLLGGLLAHFFGRGSAPRDVVAVTSPSPNAQPTATFAPAASPSVVPTVSPTPSSSPSVSPSPLPTVLAKASPSAVPSASPSPQISASVASVAPVASATPAVTPSSAAAAPKRTATPIPVETQAPAVAPAATGSDRATSVVRSYLGALARGDQSSATSYLASGLPSETFMAGAKVLSVRATPADDGHFKVSADIATSSGEYFETFTLEPGPQGLMIVDHEAIKPQ